MSYPGLVGHTHHSQARSEKFFYEIIFFVVESRATEMADRSGVIDGRVILLVHKCTLARFPNAIGYHVHCSIERDFCPPFCTRGAILHFCFAPRMCEQLI